MIFHATFFLAITAITASAQIVSTKRSFFGYHPELNIYWIPACPSSGRTLATQTGVPYFVKHQIGTSEDNATCTDTDSTPQSLLLFGAKGVKCLFWNNTGCGLPGTLGTNTEEVDNEEKCHNTKYSLKELYNKASFKCIRVQD
jgi:hypothetical protein